MPVTIQVSPDKHPEPFLSQNPSHPSELFLSAKRREASIRQENDEGTGRLLRLELSSGSREGRTLVERPNGLVHTLETAYSKHHHLTLRPDDVWLAILSQFSIYVNGHAEELRSVFVSHEGKKELEVTGAGSIETADIAGLAREMTSLLQTSIKTPSLQSWILPSFSTTTPTDTTVAAIAMMATLQAYFDFKMSLMCGIPSVTLEGTQEDWAEILRRIDYLAQDAQFGEEPVKWSKMLKPVCQSFVDCFDESKKGESAEFWKRVCHYIPNSSGPTYLCGWATVFCVWGSNGKWQGDQRSAYTMFSPGEDGVSGEWKPWPVIESGDVPRAVVEVPVKVDDNGVEIMTVMVAGLGGTQGEGKHVRPVSGWAMWEVTDTK